MKVPTVEQLKSDTPCRNKLLHLHLKLNELGWKPKLLWSWSKYGSINYLAFRKCLSDLGVRTPFNPMVHRGTIITTKRPYALLVCFVLAVTWEIRQIMKMVHKVSNAKGTRWLTQGWSLMSLRQIWPLTNCFSNQHSQQSGLTMCPLWGWESYS
jgi:hypothetical protein